MHEQLKVEAASTDAADVTSATASIAPVVTAATTDAADISVATAVTTPRVCSSTVDAADTASATAAAMLQVKHESFSTERAGAAPQAPSLSPSELGRLGAKAKHSSSAKAKAKDEIKKRWLDWQSGKLQFRNDTEFAETMLLQFRPPLESVKVIAGWCTRWKREAGG